MDTSSFYFPTPEEMGLCRRAAIVGTLDLIKQDLRAMVEKGYHVLHFREDSVPTLHGYPFRYIYDDVVEILEGNGWLVEGYTDTEGRGILKISENFPLKS